MESENELTHSSSMRLFDKPHVAKQMVRYGFQIGNLNLIYDANMVCELLKTAAIYSVPNTPKWMLGLINLRGGLVPVFDLEDYFDFESLKNQHKLLLVLGKGEKAVAFPVQHYPELLNELTKESITPKLIPKIESYIVGVYKGEKIWLELDKENFFSTLGKIVGV